ncbi:MAG: hypothetical protein E6R04_06100 [Spirochaetes bacterium]|nr:MAG: hypothetical protein E6R04_06100 [Spirochaetota bacterium]
MTTRPGYGYTFNSGGQVDPPVAVVVSNLTPAESTSLTTTQGVQFDVTVESPALLGSDDGGRMVVWVKYPDLDDKTEVAYDGAALTSTYDEGSTVTAITDGYRFLLKRNGGWISRPTVFVHVVSDLGGVNT